MNTQQQLQQLEALCTKLYVFQDSNERAQAEKALQPFTSAPEYLPQAKYLLDNATTAYAQHFATSAINKVLTKYWNNFTPSLRIEIRNHMLNYLATNAPKLQSFVVTAIIQLICRVTKLAWFDETHQQDILDEIGKFLKHSSAYYLIGVKLMNQLLLEMNEVTSAAGQTWSEHRKTCNSFRDKCMLQIFKISLTSLVELFKSGSTEEQLKDQALELAYRCLTFDFLGTSPEDSTDDLGSVQAPTSWKPLFEDDSTIKLFLQIYVSSQPPRSTQALQCLVQIASIRSLFNETERDVFLGYLIEASKEILQFRAGLNEQPNHHEFSRFLARLKGNFQASSIVASKSYSEWIQQVAVFTMNSFNHWQWSPNSVFFLLTFWARLVLSVYYIKNKEASMIETLAPQIIQAFMTARLEAIQQASADEGIDEDEEQLLEQMEALPHLGRCKYETTRNFLMSIIDPISQTFRKIAEMPQSARRKEVSVVEGQLSLIVYCVGSMIGGRQNIIHTSEEHDQVDAELAARVLELMRLHDTRLTTSPDTPSKAKLELAFLEFVEFFRKAYLSDQASNSSKLYPRLSELIGISDSKTLLQLYVTKIATNLKYWAKDEKIIYKTLYELHELASGYASSKILLKLELTNQFLAYHTSQFFPFLDFDGNFKNRALYYTSLARLLFTEDNFAKFEAFVEPFKQTLTILRDQTAPDVYRTDSCKKVLMGIFRDFLGIMNACASRRSYNLIFDFIYPDYVSVILRTAEVLYDRYEVMNPLLKFFSEFVFSKGSRINFDSSSVNGILLFRESSKLLVAYGSRIISFTPSTDAYREKYVGIIHAMNILNRSINGNYVNFGVFGLYGDAAFSDAVNVTMKLALSVPLKELGAYPKLLKSYFSLMETMSDKHVSILAKLDTPSFVQLLVCLRDGVDSVETSVSSQSCAVIERIVSFRYATGKSVDQTALGMLNKHFSENAELFNSILTFMFQRALDNCQNLWSFSRPVFCLILLNPEHFMNLKSQLISRQPSDRQQQLVKDFEDLMKDIRNTLESQNRDKFSQNFNSFVQDVRKYIVL